MIEKVFIISFIVFAIYATMEDGMIFEFIQDWYWKATKNWKETKADYFAKPLFFCPVCMSFWYGSIIYWLLYHNSWQEWAVVIFSSMGVITILVKLFPEK